jgi:hypothetical protein
MHQANSTRILIIKFSIFLTLCFDVTIAPIDLEFPIFGNVIGFLLLFVILIKNLKYSLFAFLLSTLVLLFYLIVNPNYFFNSIDPYKSFIYALIAITLSIDFRKKNYTIYLKSIFFKYIVFSLILFLFGIGVDLAGDAKRIQGLLSEPSALGFILCFLFWTYIKDKDYKKLLIVTLTIILTFSLVVFAVIIISFLLKLLTDFNKKSITIISIMFIFFSASFVYLKNTENEHWLIYKASEAVKFISSGGQVGKNSRSVDFDKLIKEQGVSKYSFYIGNGPSFGAFNVKKEDTLSNTQNLPSILFMDYGILGLSLGSLWILYALFKLKNSIYRYLFLSILSYSLINTASGIVNDIYLYTLLFYSSNLLFNYSHKNSLKEINI